MFVLIWLGEWICEVSCHNILYCDFILNCIYLFSRAKCYSDVTWCTWINRLSWTWIWWFFRTRNNHISLQECLRWIPFAGVWPTSRMVVHHDAPNAPQLLARGNIGSAWLLVKCIKIIFSYGLRIILDRSWVDERRRYTVRPSLIGWVPTQNEKPC